MPERRNGWAGVPAAGALLGRRALITGASSGLGAHFAAVLAREGCHVTLTARRVAALDAIAEQLRNDGASCAAVAIDVSAAASVEAALTTIGDVDILVNNAGVVREAAAFDQTEDDWDAVMDTNLKGMFLVAQAVGRRMRDRGCGGSMINIASILGLRQAGGVLPYAVSKAGVIQLTKQLALEWARFDIRVNALAPGYIDTELNRVFWGSEAGRRLIARVPQRRLGRPDDLDGPLLLLASDASRYMTGAVLAVDGGHLVSSL